MEEGSPSDTVYDKYLNFLSRYSKYNSMQFIYSLYHEIEVEIPTIRLQLPTQTPKPKPPPREIVKTRSVQQKKRWFKATTTADLQAFLSRTLSDIQPVVYNTCQNSIEEICNPEVVQTLSIKHQDQVYSDPGADNRSQKSQATPSESPGEDAPMSLKQIQSGLSEDVQGMEHHVQTQCVQVESTPKLQNSLLYQLKELVEENVYQGIRPDTLQESPLEQSPNHQLEKQTDSLRQETTQQLQDQAQLNCPQKQSGPSQEGNFQFQRQSQHQGSNKQWESYDSKDLGRSQATPGKEQCQSGEPAQEQVLDRSHSEAQKPKTSTKVSFRMARQLKGTQLPPAVQTFKAGQKQKVSKKNFSAVFIRRDSRQSSASTEKDARRKLMMGAFFGALQ